MSETPAPANRIRTVQLPEAGEGVELIFRATDIVRIQENIGSHFVIDAFDAFERFDTNFIKTLLDAGVKKLGQPTTVDIDKLIPEKMTMVELTTRVMDGLFLCLHGRTFEEHVAYAVQRQKELKDRAEADENPPTTRKDSSAV
jgi:hypothetical protein